jgi:predicted nuclease of predicted toxin-antitoxin system
LLDEHVSPSLVGKLGDKDVFAVAATHVGLSGEPDAKIWSYAFENDFVVVTGNARDFIRLLNVEVHPGLIVLREGGLTRGIRKVTAEDEQFLKACGTSIE